MASTSILQAHPVAYLAPTLTSLTVQAFQSGLVFDLSIKFWSRSHMEHKLINMMVIFVFVIATYQTIATFTSLWRLDVVHFGDWTEQFVLTWPDRLQSAVTAALSSPIQVFLIRRCWLLTNKNSLVLDLLSSLLSSTIGLNIYLCFAMFSLSLSHGPRSTLPIDQPYNWSLILTAVLDFALTSILFIFLWHSRSDVFTRRVRRTIRRIMLISWEAAAIPAICAVLSALLYITMGRSNYWSLFFHANLGKFYAISLLITLNARADFRKSHCVERPVTPRRVVGNPPFSIGDSLQTNVSSSVHHDLGEEPSSPKDIYLESNMV
ncbi:hypothetical protein JAAARDRAFT_497795 [Jaapia argillacea MUCL 33604]|uniref:DUF6534 domain-containing protein n=1 Tax=Jaapia argillacea MUCL 33604 TaxID=933084 RepID=A0A067PA01_9AGAM|nr:hypothetical protein JAAARDRAFT_497795 [Jaapia argillacea MUCL 33604]